MLRLATLLLLLTFLPACSTNRLGQGDHWLQWEENGATLYVYGKDGQLAAYGQELLNLPGYFFSDGGVRFHPGKRRVGYGCGPLPGGVMLMDSLPSLEYDFKAGESYELHCKDGLPVITQRRPGA